mmetsp:Transcript_35349/g.60039  ORF Transcript_35349/g.60039 Transcript_35349/m.60039 type:complete len:238 (+) Transcript_35349:557-1270(+)
MIMFSFPIVYDHGNFCHVPSPAHGMQKGRAGARYAIPPVDQIDIKRFQFGIERFRLILQRDFLQPVVPGIAVARRIANVGKGVPKVILPGSVARLADPGGIAIDAGVARDADEGGDVGGFAETEFEDGRGVVVKAREELTIGVGQSSSGVSDVADFVDAFIDGLGSVGHFVEAVVHLVEQALRRSRNSRCVIGGGGGGGGDDCSATASHCIDASPHIHRKDAVGVEGDSDDEARRDE